MAEKAGVENMGKDVVVRAAASGDVILEAPTTAKSVYAVVNGVKVASLSAAGIGYPTGQGGAVTQITNRSTGVTLSKLCGSITTDATSLAAGAEATFIVTNTLVAATDVVVLSQQTPSATGTSFFYVSETAAGSFSITLTNLHASTADTSASVVNFVVLKSVAA